ncbi:MAG: hypothetical protein IKR13_02655 [Victivallales bacterium]|nr:hypothetical protein [Victivallales bacterium]
MELRRLLQLALCLGVLLWLTVGCVGIQSDPNSDLPGNVPASWEGQSLGMPM